MLLNVIKKPHKVVTNNEGNNTSTNLQRKELKISWLHRSLYICNVCDWSLPMKETQYTWLVSQDVKALKIVLYCNFNKSEGISCILHQRGQAQLLKKKTGKKKHEKELRKSCQVSVWLFKPINVPPRSVLNMFSCSKTIC